MKALMPFGTEIVPFVIFRITRTQVSDGATYTCVASNRAGVDNRHYNLEVHGECENRRYPPSHPILVTLFSSSAVSFYARQSLPVWMELEAQRT